MSTTTTTNNNNNNAGETTLTTSPPSSSQSTLQHQLLQFSCGAMAGISSKTCVAPLERLKTIYQVQTSNHTPPTWKQGFAIMWKDGGFKGLFRGNLANCLKSAPSASLKLYLFEHCKRLFAETDHQLTASQLFVSGSAAGLLSHTCVYPLDVIRTRLSATAMGTYVGITDCVLKMTQQEGVFSLYRGLTASLGSALMSSGISLMVYEQVKYSLVPVDAPAGSLIGLLGLSIAGGTGSFVSQCIVYPIKTVKSRMIMSGQVSACGSSTQAYGGITDVFVKTLKNEGIKGFYKGFLPSLIKTVPSHCIGFTVYDTSRRFFNLEKLQK